MDFDYSTETITPDNTALLTIGGTGALEVPVGTTANRPVTGLANGALRYNNDINDIEGYINSGWVAISTGSTTTTLTGDVTGSGTSSIATTLATVNANVGTFAVQTVNAKGLVTAAQALSGDITSSGAVTTLATVNSNVGTFSALTVNGKGLVTAATNLAATGDATGTASGSGLALTLATVNSNVGTFASVTVNGKGLVTAAANLSGDITTSGAVTTLATVNGNVGTFASATFNAKGLATAAANLSGDITTSGSVSTLATVNAGPVTASFQKVTTNGKGLVTATTAVTASDITTALTYTPVNKAGDSMSGTLTMDGTHTVTGLPTPVNASDAAPKGYVDSAVAGLSWKQAAKAASTAALTVTYSNGASGVGATLTNAGTQAAFAIDGYTAAQFDRILIKNQTSTFQNGIYTVTTVGSGSTNWVLTRAVDSNTAVQIDGEAVYVQQGTTLADTGWTETATVATVGTDAVIYAQFSGSGSYSAGTGLSLTGNVFANTGVLSNVAGSGISVSGATGNVTIGNTGVLSITGTANQVIASGATGAVTLSLPQSINSGAAPTFAGTNFTGIPNGALTNSSLTVTAGTGMSGGGVVSLGGSVTLTNAGVTSAVAGTGISVSGATGAVTISNTGVTSVALALPSIFTVSGSPVTTTGTLTGTLATQTTNTVFVAPNGSTGAPTFRALAYADLPLKLYVENPSSPTAPLAAGANAIGFGTGTSASATVSEAHGSGSIARVYGEVASAAGSFATIGDAQHGEYNLRISTANATVTEAFLDGASARLVLPNNSAYMFVADIVCRRTDAVGTVGAWTVSGLIFRDASAATTAISGAVSKTTIAKTTPTMDVALSADTTNGSLKVAVTGVASQTIRWSIHIRTQEVTN